MKNSSEITWKSWGTLLLLAIAWGTSYILIKKGLEAFSPTQVACIRIGITSITFIPFLIWQLKDVKWEKWKELFVVGFIGSLLPAFLFATAQTKISSSLSGILSSLTPLFTLFLGVIFFKVPSTWTKITGVLMGLVGAIWLLIVDRGLDDIKGVVYGLFVVGACFCYALSSNVVKARLQDTKTLLISAVSYIMVGLPSIIYLFFDGFIATMQQQPSAWPSFWYVALLAISSTVMGSLLFFKLIKDTNVIFASTVSYLIPMVAIIWGAIDGEQITLMHLAGMAFILLGVYVARK